MSSILANPQPAVAGPRERLRARTWLGRHRGGVVASVAGVFVAQFAARKLADDPTAFFTTFLNGLSAGALYFLVASGFTLIFGLLRVTNLAHGAFYLLGGYVGFAVHEQTGNWALAVLGGAAAVVALGGVTQLVLLRGMQGQELREALVTLGLAIVVGDQILAGWGGEARDIPAPGALDGPVTLLGVTYPGFRLAVVGFALVIGLALWAVLKRTRLGMVIRAGVDDRHMVSSLGIRVPLVFLAVFGIGAALAGFSGVVGGSYLSLQPGEDSRFLLYSLAVVIIGGLGSVPGAALGALLVGMVDQFGGFYEPTYSVLLTFGVMVLVLVVRPQGILGRDVLRRAGAQTQAMAASLPSAPGVEARRRALVAAAVVLVLLVALPAVATQFFLVQIAIKSLWLGVVALSLVFLAAYAGMVSLAQTALYGTTGYVVANLTQLHGWAMGPAVVAGIGAAVVLGALFGLLTARSRGVYFLMLTIALGVFVYYFALQNRSLTNGFSGINGISPPTVLGVDLSDPTAFYYAALAVAAICLVALRRIVRTPFGLALQGVRDGDVRMTAMGYGVTAHRVAAFAIAGLVAGAGGVLAIWYNGQISPGAVDLQRTIDILVVAVIGGLYRFQGAFIGAVVVTALQNYGSDYTGRFTTVIGVLFVVVLLVSPGGLVGIWDDARRRLTRREAAATEEVAGVTGTS